MHEIHEAWHFKIGRGGTPDMASEEQSAKRLGSYSTRDKAIAAVGNRRGDIGFRDWPDGFRIYAVPLDPDGGGSVAGKLDRIYALWHFRIGAGDEADSDDSSQVPTRIGLYSTEENVSAAIARYKDDQRFQDFPDGFRVFSAPPDIDHWDGGFVSWDEA